MLILMALCHHYLLHTYLQAALFISSWTKQKYKNDQLHHLSFNIRGQIFAQGPMQIYE